MPGDGSFAFETRASENRPRAFEIRIPGDGSFAFEIRMPENRPREFEIRTPQNRPRALNDVQGCRGGGEDGQDLMTILAFLSGSST